MSHPAFQNEFGNDVEFGEIVSIIGWYNDEEFGARVKERASDSRCRDLACRSMAPAANVKKQFAPPAATVMRDAMPFVSRHGNTERSFALDGLWFDAGLRDEPSR
ncbi:hypothetical protein [Mesorhizobium japonicum]|uniref:hypothetical protein n=1 Tax=Mesorhizobium japonicum TaxID=2066070 RepID=UPI0005C9B0A3|nr:hypothetical protein [Mesorhizobium japonicum]